MIENGLPAAIRETGELWNFPRVDLLEWTSNGGGKLAIREAMALAETWKDKNKK